MNMIYTKERVLIESFDLVWLRKCDLAYDHTNEISQGDHEM